MPGATTGYVEGGLVRTLFNLQGPVLVWSVEKQPGGCGVQEKANL